MEFADEDAAMDWMDANQLGRRNLTPDQRSIMRGRRYNRTKKAKGGDYGNQHTPKLQSDTLPDTATALAAEHVNNLSPREPCQHNTGATATQPRGS